LTFLKKEQGEKKKEDAKTRNSKKIDARKNGQGKRKRPAKSRKKPGIEKDGRGGMCDRGKMHSRGGTGKTRPAGLKNAERSNNRQRGQEKGFQWPIPQEFEPKLEEKEKSKHAGGGCRHDMGRIKLQ